MKGLSSKTIDKIIQIFSKTEYDVEFLWNSTEVKGTNRVLPIKCNLCNHVENLLIFCVSPMFFEEILEVGHPGMLPNEELCRGIVFSK